MAAALQENALALSALKVIVRGQSVEHLQIPRLVAATDTRAFLQALVEINQARDPKFSLRWFCQRLEWPPAYINDVLAQRRQLSLNRALELARFLKLDALETEHLVLLTLGASTECPVATHFQRERRVRFGAVEEAPETTRWLVDEIEATLVFALLAAVGRRLSPSVIRRRLYTLSDRTDAELEDFVGRLEAQGLIESGDGDELRFPHQNLSFQMGHGKAQAATVFAEHFRSAIRYLESPRRASPGVVHSRFASLTRARFDEVAARLAQLEGWMGRTLDGDPPDTATHRIGDPEPREVYQFTAVLLPLSRSDEG